MVADSIDWEKGRLRVNSPKTEHHPGGAFRMVPLFPELKPYLEASWDAAEEGAVYVLPERFRRGALKDDVWKAVNLRTTFEKIVLRAGVEPWPRLFQNLRSSRETELVEQFPVHVVARWLGNTQRVASKHYLQVTDEHFQAAQIPAQQGAARSGILCQLPSLPSPQRHSLQDFATTCDTIQMNRPGELGFEVPANSLGNPRILTGRGANSGAQDDLATILEAWPTLPQSVRERILALVQAAGLGCG